MKRGQLTLFVIVALIVVGGIIASIVFFSSGDDDSLNERPNNFAGNEKLSRVQDDLYDCVDFATRESLILVTLQGGYARKPETVFNYDPVFFPYYYFEGDLTIPTIETISEELAHATVEEISNCLQLISQDDATLNYPEGSASVSIVKDDVTFIVDVPVEVVLESDSYVVDLSEYKKSYNSSLFEMHEVATYIATSHVEDPEYFCVSCVSDFAEERNLRVYFYQQIISENITGVVISDEASEVSNPYSYSFFSKYSLEAVTPKLSSV